jgi:hypothetical protein
MEWVPPSHAVHDHVQGLTVFSNDGQPIGTIEEVLYPIDLSEGKDKYVLRVKAGLLDTAELYVPESAVQLVEDERVVLGRTYEQVAEQNLRASGGAKLGYPA